MKQTTDIAILGGGCAGLSLAVALAEYAPHLRVHILEARREYRRDRTWCFWNTEPHAFEACVSHSWSRWRVRSGRRAAVQQSRRYQYQHIAADHFYESALRLIEAAPGHKIELGVQVVSVSPNGEGVRVETSAGAVQAKWVFDSRPWVQASRQDEGLVQRFTGWHVRTERECFDPSTVDLMDFQPSPVSGRIAFFYILPFTKNEALVEATYIDDPELVAAEAEAALIRRIEEVSQGGRYEVLFRERGALPMRFESAVKQIGAGARIVRIGTAGGRVKPSSGYAFLRIQRQSRLVAQALGSGRAIPHLFEPKVYGALDKIFLTALKQHPEATADYFLKLFGNVPADYLVRFLSEDGNWQECLSVVRALPVTPFLQAAVSLLDAAA